MTGEQTEVIEHAARSGRDPRWRRFVGIVLAALGVFIAVLGVVVVYQYATTNSLRGQVGALGGQVELNARDAQQLYAQIRGLGVTPVVHPPPLPGPAGAQGPAGQNGINGIPGPPGSPGMPGPTGPAGSPGVSGSPGAPGAAGVNGQDGQPGAAGPSGPAGPTGPSGAAGSPGPACPDGYSPQPALIVEPDGSTHQGIACVADTPTTTTNPPILPIPQIIPT